MPVHLTAVIGAVPRYYRPKSEEAREMQKTVRVEGERSVRNCCTGIEKEPFVDLVELADRIRPQDRSTMRWALLLGYASRNEMRGERKE